MKKTYMVLILIVLILSLTSCESLLVKDSSSSILYHIFK